MKKRLKSCIPALLAAAMLSASCTPVFASESGSHLNVAMFMWMEGLDPAEGLERLDHHALWYRRNTSDSR